MLAGQRHFAEQELIRPQEFRWYVARTHARKEEVARVNLANQGLQVFLPRISETRRSEKGFREHECPLFPSYIFFKAPTDQALWRSVSGTRGISYIVGTKHGLPTPVPSAVMTQLLQLGPDGLINFGRPAFLVGDAVAVRKGPLTGLSAHIHALDNHGRVELLLDIMGGARTVIDSGDIVHT